MIVKQIAGGPKYSRIIVPEDSDDLFTLRRIIEVGDNITADTTRIIKQIKEFSRPDKGERIQVRILLRADNIYFDGSLDRIRIAGIIINSNNDLVPKGVHHSISIQVGDVISVDKKREWYDSELSLLLKSSNRSSFILIGIDNHEAAIAKIVGTHVKIFPNIYSGQSGKRYHGKKVDPDIDIFYKETSRLVKNSLDTIDDGHNIIIFGPGETKKKFLNFLADQIETKTNISVIDGVDVAGEDGVYVALRSESMKKIMENSKLGIVSSVLDKIASLIHRSDLKFAIGINEVRIASNRGATEYVIYSDSILNSIDETEFIQLLNIAEKNGTKIYGVDSTTDMGLRVSALGGIVALLRYQISYN